MLTLFALIVGGFVAYQGVVPRSLEVFGNVFLAVRLVSYVLLFVVLFDTITAPMLNAFTRVPRYAEVNVKPYRFRCLFWALFLEFFVSIL